MNERKLNEIIGSRPVLRHTCANGAAKTLRYNAVITDTYEALRAAYVEEGYTLYCEEPSNPIRSVTYVKGNEYAVLFLFSWEKQLHVTVSKRGAKNLPEAVGEYNKVCPVTLTQPKTAQQDRKSVV